MLQAKNLEVTFNPGTSIENKVLRGLGFSLNRTLREEFRDRLRILNLGLENRLSDRIGLLSGGQRQAVSLLMA